MYGLWILSTVSLRQKYAKPCIYFFGHPHCLENDNLMNAMGMAQQEMGGGQIVAKRLPQTVGFVEGRVLAVGCQVQNQMLPSALFSVFIYKLGRRGMSNMIIAFIECLCA